ncbi:MAG: hypothetical protein Kow006_31130 [Gammaproteobacteria bacterium]
MPGVIFRVAFWLGGAILLAGCATLNKSECLTADWHTIGYEDGAQGYPLTRVSEHRKACAEHGIQPDLHAYRAGHGEGVRLFCTPRKAYQFGLQGRVYREVCPKDLEPDFLSYYAAGKEIYRLTRRLRRDERVLRDLRREYVDYLSLLERKERELVRPGLTRQERQRLLDEIKSLSASLVAFEAALYTHERSLELQRREIERRRLTF